MSENMQQSFTQRWWVSVGSAKVYRCYFAQTRAIGQRTREQGSNLDAPTWLFLWIWFKSFWKIVTMPENRSSISITADLLVRGCINRFWEIFAKVRQIKPQRKSEESAGSKTNRGLRLFLLLLSASGDLVSLFHITTSFSHISSPGGIIWAFLIVYVLFFYYCIIIPAPSSAHWQSDTFSKIILYFFPANLFRFVLIKKRCHVVQPSGTIFLKSGGKQPPPIPFTFVSSANKTCHSGLRQGD